MVLFWIRNGPGPLPAIKDCAPSVSFAESGYEARYWNDVKWPVVIPRLATCAAAILLRLSVGNDGEGELDTTHETPPPEQLAVNPVGSTTSSAPVTSQ